MQNGGNSSYTDSQRIPNQIPDVSNSEGNVAKLDRELKVNENYCPH